MKFQILSDIHLEFYNNKLPKNICNEHFPKAPTLFLVGDIGYPKNPLWLEFIEWCEVNYERIFYVTGNHEYYKNNIDEIDTYVELILGSKPKFTFLKPGVISSIEDYKVIGCTLWSKQHLNVYWQMNDSKYVYNNNLPLKLDALLDLHQKHKEWIETNVDSNTIVVTHHLPSFDLIHPKYKTKAYEEFQSAYASDCNDILSRARAWIYGHTHLGSDVMFQDKVRCICNPYGYPNESHKYFTNKVFEIE